jgi:hypothetical protein
MLANIRTSEQSGHMHKATFLIAILFAAPVHSATPRCGTDDFGNTVCMDKDGVLTNAPGQSAVGRSGKAKKKAEAAGTPDDNGDKGGKPRCAIDQFGNTVCSQYLNNNREK